MLEASASANEQISGFYGPGSWAAWVVMLASSWISVYLNDYDSNVHFIAYTLYTNWAAVDLIRHLYRFRFNQPVEKSQDNQLTQTIIVSGAIIFIGNLHYTLQGVVCVLKLWDANARTKQRLRQRLLIVSLGLILPFSAFLCFMFTMLRSLSALFIVQIQYFIWLTFFVLAILRSLPADPNHLTAIFIIFLMLFGFYGIAILWGQMLPMDERGEVLLSSLGLYTCLYIPCAPQKIDEWDQLFTLLVSLIFFFYEFKARILALLGRLFKPIIVHCWNSVVGCFRTSPFAPENPRTAV